MDERPPVRRMRLKARLVVIDDPVNPDVMPTPELDAAILAWAERHFDLDSPIITVRRLVEEEL